MMAALYPTKKALRASIGQDLAYRETSIFGSEFRPNGSFCVVGPSEYDRRWYAQVEMRDGKIYKVK